MYDGVEIRINRYGLLLSLEEELSEFSEPSVSCWGDGYGGQGRTNLQLDHGDVKKPRRSGVFITYLYCRRGSFFLSMD